MNLLSPAFCRLGVAILVLIGSLPLSAITQPHPDRAQPDCATCTVGIVFNGSNVNGQTLTVYAGQKIELDSSVNSVDVAGTLHRLESDASCTQSYSFSPAQSTQQIIGGYDYTLASNQLLPLPSFSTTAATAFDVVFYWVAGQPSNVTITYSGCYGGATYTGAVTFSVLGPTNVQMAAPMFNKIAVLPNGQYLGRNAGPGLELGNPATVSSSGFVSSTTMTAPAGNAGSQQYIQTLTLYTRHLCIGGGAGCTVQNLPGSPSLDNMVPYINSTSSMSDSPGIGLVTSKTEEQAQFQATSYAVWLPNAAMGCTTYTNPTTNQAYICNTYVPLASVSWNFCGCALNTLNPQVDPTGWSLSSSSGPSAGTIAPGLTASAYPQWSALFTNQ